MNLYLKKIIISACCVISFFAEAQSGITYLDSITSNGLKRKFRLYVPNSYSASIAAPLVFNLHGYGSNAQQQQAYANFMPIADTAKFLVVSPDGTSAFGSQFWEIGYGSGVNDVQFISNLIDSIKLNYNIDLNSVYSCGMSNGGIMSYYLACNLPNRITAIASVTGSMLNLWYSCAPSRPFPIMEIHGTADATVPYAGDMTFAPIDNIVNKWRVHNNCNPTAVTYSVPNINLIDGNTAVNFKYTGGTNGSSVELYKVIGGSHSWPGGAPVIANTNQDFSASVEIWRFFRQFKLNQIAANVGIQSFFNFNDDIKIYPNPTSNILNVKFEKTHTAQTNMAYEIEIFNSFGQIMLSETKVIDHLDFNIQNFESGIYFLAIKTDNGTICKKFVKK